MGKLKEEIADIIQEMDSEGRIVDVCKDLSKDLQARTIRASYLSEAERIMERVEQAGYVQLASDQSLPSVAPIQYTAVDTSYTVGHCEGYSKGIRDGRNGMLKAGFKKVITN